MTLHSRDAEVGVRDLHDRLSEHLDRVERGTDLIVTRRGRPVARLSAITGDESLEDFVGRGLMTPPERSRRARTPEVSARASVADLVAEQRR
jgi:prevent-host-death family protein